MQVAHVIRLCNDAVQISYRWRCAERNTCFDFFCVLRVEWLPDEIRNIHQHIGVFFQFSGIKTRVYACDEIFTVVGVVYVYDIGASFLKVVVLVMYNRHVFREFSALIMEIAEAVVGIPVVIWYGYDICVAVRVG